MKPTITFIMTIFVLTGFSQQRLVKKRTETSISTYLNDKGKKKTQKQLQSFIGYDKQGKEIEHGNFGESFGTRVIGKDSSLTWYCGKDYSKINAVDFFSYDSNGKKIKAETWFYKGNKKSWTSGYSIFRYNDLGLLTKEITFSENDSIRKTKTFTYALLSNNIEIIDSTFESTLNPGKTSIHKIINNFDTLKRIVLATEFSCERLLLRRRFLYGDGTDMVTELRYENASDTSLWSITETKIGYVNKFPCQKKTLENFVKIINSPTEWRKIYTYNKDCLLDKIEHYSGVILTGYSKFDYEYY